MFYPSLSSVPDKQKKEAVLLNSGGIDSRTIAKMAVDAGYTLHSLFVDTNPAISKISRKAAAETAELYCADHEIFEWPVDWRIKKSAGHFTLPFSGLSAHLAGAQYAAFKGCSLVLVGDKQVERQTQHFEWLDKIIAFSYGAVHIHFLAPIWKNNFDDVIKIAAEKGVDLTTTFSCNEPDTCGKCFSCVNRARVGL